MPKFGKQSLDRLATCHPDLQKVMNEAKYLLDSTQFKFGEDYDLKYTPEWEELKIKRQEAREFIRSVENN